jgi:hypothetical protein
MFTIRCTQKLLRRLQCSAEASTPTTALGDWYANILFARPEQLVVCVSERTLLPVVLVARPAASLGNRLTNALAEVLSQLRTPSCLIEQEQAEMATFAYSTTRNRRVLGTLNEFLFQLSWYLHDEPSLSLIDASLKLARTPCGAISGFPDRLTAALFGGAATDRALVQ